MEESSPAGAPKSPNTSKSTRKMFPDQNQHYLRNYRYNYQGAYAIKESEYGNHFLYDQRKVSSNLRSSPRYARKSIITRYDVAPYSISPRKMGEESREAATERQLETDRDKDSRSKGSGDPSSRGYLKEAELVRAVEEEARNPTNLREEPLHSLAGNPLSPVPLSDVPQPHPMAISPDSEQQEQPVKYFDSGAQEERKPEPIKESDIKAIGELETIPRKDREHHTGTRSSVPPPKRREVVEEDQDLQQKTFENKKPTLLMTEPNNPFITPDINRLRFKQKLDMANKKQDLAWKAYLERMFPDVAKEKRGIEVPTEKKYNNCGSPMYYGNKANEEPRRVLQEAARSALKKS